MLKFAFKAVILLIIFSTTANTFADRDIYLVRHAEKEVGASKNPSLTEKGRLRADNLAEQLKTKNISAIYSTNYKRTLQTAAPLAKLLGLKIKQYNPRELKAFADKLKSLSGNILVVGHSNTTPALASYVGGTDQEAMVESEYQRLYQIHFSGDEVSTILLKTKP